MVNIDGKVVTVGSNYRDARLVGLKSTAALFIHKIDGHFAVGRSCTICSYGVVKRKERNPGRGWGMREGNILRGKVIQHIKETHSELIGKEMCDEQD